MLPSPSRARCRVVALCWFILCVVGVVPGAAQTLSDEERAGIDAVVSDVLAQTEAPGASVAVVRDGQLVYAQAYGIGRLDPPKPANPGMRYAIGSVSKQFTAAAVLLLAEEGELSLEDPVARWLPELARAKEVSIRQLLSMTSGYQDYWPHDYVFPAMLEPVAPRDVLDRWARKPLDFDPGSDWQYSNANYVIAGLIVERVAGKSLLELLRERVFEPLGMSTVRDFDAGPLTSEDAGAYLRNALGPLRPAPKEAEGWLFAAGGLAMTASDLAKWNIGMIERTLLRPESWAEMQTEARLRSGLAVGYGLGVGVGSIDGRRRIAHGGAVSGYATSNQVFPDQRVAVVALVNVWPGAAGPAARIADGVAGVLFAAEDAADEAAKDLAREMLADLQRGEVDRALLSANARAYFSPEVLSDFETSLGPLGAPDEFAQTSESLRGGMTFRAYRLRYGDRRLVLTTRTLPGGEIEQFQVERAD